MAIKRKSVSHLLSELVKNAADAGRCEVARVAYDDAGKVDKVAEMDQRIKVHLKNIEIFKEEIIERVYQ